MNDLTLRGWQAEFLTALANRDEDNFLLVACPAAGKTIAGGAAAGQLMDELDADQLIVVAPTVVVRDQWRATLEKLGFRLTTKIEDTDPAWPVWVHGVVCTYAQLSWHVHSVAAQLGRRRTVAIMDEVHHAGQQLSWGAALEDALAPAASRLLLSGTPFRSDKAPIPFVSYGEDGECIADFAYDYPRAAREGICRAVEFRAHDGEITFVDDAKEEVKARFTDELQPADRSRRLRAALDPSQPFLRDLLAEAHEDLLRLREKVPDAGGLVVCDTQLHALAVDRALNEITGSVPTLAISEIPRAHQAIRDFATSDDAWLVSVRMVAEGVDLPRLGVIVWATASSTELMVRQIVGRGIRGREDLRGVSAIVHMPADPTLEYFAERLHVLRASLRMEGGRAIGVRARGEIPYRRKLKPRNYKPAKPSGLRAASIDPAPFVAWFEGVVESIGLKAACKMVGFTDEGRAYNRWKHAESGADALTIYDACHFAGVGFDDLYAGDEWAETRKMVHDPEAAAFEIDYGCVEATGSGMRALAPQLPPATVDDVGKQDHVVTTPALPPSPSDLEEAAQAATQLRADLFRLLGSYADLRRELDPGFTVAAASVELARGVGAPVTAESDDETVAAAMEFLSEKAAAIALEHPQLVKDLARRKRRLALSREGL
jgi:superfamily II DNA or RNA helicase